MCSIILLYIFFNLYIYCCLLDTILSRNNKSKSNKNTLASLSNSVGNRFINLENNYKETSNRKGINQGSTMEKDRSGIP